MKLAVLLLFSMLLACCRPELAPSVDGQTPNPTSLTATIPSGFVSADGSYQLTFPKDFGSHPDYRTEWWYYTGNLQTPDGRPFGFELTIFRVGLLPPTTELPGNSMWSGRDIYFAHFAVGDIASEQFHAFERYSRSGPGLAGAQANPYRVWVEDWDIGSRSAGVYQLQALQDRVRIDLTLTDELGVVLHGENGYSRKGSDTANASYYYSQPLLRAEGLIELNGVQYPVRGQVWKDHEFSTGVLDANQIGWDWFSLQFEDGRALMLFQLRERGGDVSDSSSGTFIGADGEARALLQPDFKIDVLDIWQSPHTGGVYPSAWEIRIDEPNCRLQIRPWMADQEINFPAVTYWEGAVRFDGICDGSAVHGNGYIELTGYAGNLPLP